MEHTVIQDNDTIDLRELFQTIAKRKKLIVTITGLFVLLAALYVFVLAKPVYEVKAMIEIGKINEKPLDNVADIKQKLEYLYGVTSKKKREYPKVKAITASKKAKGLLTVTVDGHDNQKSIAYINKIVEKIESEYAEKVNTYVNTQKELMALSKEDITTAKHNLEKVQSTLENYNQKMMNITAADAALAGIYTIQISQNQAQIQALQSKISALKAKLFTMELSISPLRIKPTHIVGKVEVLDKPVKPNKRLIIIVSFIIGLIFSIFLVLFLEFLRGLKEETK